MEPSPLQKMLLSSVVLLLLFLLKPLHALDIHNHHKYVFNNKFKALNRRFLVELNATTSPESFLATIPTEYQDLIKVHKSFTHELFRGLSIEILDQEHAVLRSMLGFPNIISISPNTIIERRRTIPRQVDQLQNTSGSPTLSRDWVQKLLPHSSSQVDKVHQELNLTGEGIFIGIIDDGKYLYFASFSKYVYLILFFVIVCRYRLQSESIGRRIWPRLQSDGRL